MLLVLADPLEVCCPQGSELPGDVSTLCGLFVWWVLTVFDDVSSAIGRNVGVGLGTKPKVEGNGVLGKGYIPGCLNCLSMRSASPVTLSIMVVVSYSSGKSWMSL